MFIVIVSSARSREREREQERRASLSEVREHIANKRMLQQSNLNVRNKQRNREATYGEQIIEVSKVKNGCKCTEAKV